MYTAYNIMLLLLLPGLMAITFVILQINRHKLERSTYWVLAVYLMSNLVVECVAATRTVWYARSTEQLYNAPIIFEPIAFLLIFYLFERSQQWKKLIVRLIVFYALFALLNLLFIQTASILNSYSYALACLVLMGLCYHRLSAFVLRNDSADPLTQFIFWFSVGVLFCYLGNLPFLIFFRILSRTDQMRDIFTNISLTVNTILFVMISTGLICHREVKSLY